VQKEEARETNVQRTKPEVVEKPEPQVKPILRQEAKRPEVVGLSKPQAESVAREGAGKADDWKVRPKASEVKGLEQPQHVAKPVVREEARNVNAWKSRPEAIEAREDQDYWTWPESVRVAGKPEALDQRRCVTCGYPMPAGSDECPICAPRLRSPAVGVARKAAVTQQPVSAPKPEPVVRAVSEPKEDVVVARKTESPVEPSPRPKAVVPEPAVQKPEVPVEPAPRSEPSAPRPAPKPVAIPVSEAEKPAPRVDHVSRTPAQTSQPRVKTVSLTGMVVVKPKTLPGVKPRSGGESG
jgi:rubrerythrin